MNTIWAKRLCFTEDNSSDESTGEDNGNEDNEDIEKQSYSNRICDDLSELILDFLPIEDKIKLSSVSKQFKTCLQSIRQKQTCLQIGHNWTNGRNSYNNLMKKVSIPEDAEPVYEVNVKRLERVLKIFKNINEIRIEKVPNSKSNEDNNTEVLETIVNHCTDLEAFEFDFDGCPSDVIENFGEKFGEDLKHLKVLGNIAAIEPLIEFCPNLLTINRIHINCLVNNEEILAKDLTQLTVYGFEDIDSVDVLVTDCPKLTHLYLTSYEDISEALLLVTKLKELRVLSIDNIISDEENEGFQERMDKTIQSIALKCKKLKSFELKVCSNDFFNVKHCFEKFSTLKRLSINSTQVQNENEIPIEKLDINFIENCNDLTHLSLTSNQINDDFFDGIDSVVPHLKYLKITTKNELTDKALNSIARLKNLETIKLTRRQSQDLNSITDSGIVSLINYCNDLHTIIVNNKTNINKNTIDAMIQKAAEYPGIYFRYYFDKIDNNSNLESIIKRAHRLKNITITGDYRCLGQVFKIR